MQTVKSRNTTLIRELLAIISGLSIGNTLLMLVTLGTMENVQSGTDVLRNLPALLFTAIHVFNVLRFHHGNVRVLEESERPDSPQDPRSTPTLSFFITFVQGLLIAVLSFYALRPFAYVQVFLLLLAVDVFWTALSHISLADGPIKRAKQIWLVINIGTIFTLAMLLFAVLGSATPAGGPPLAMSTLSTYLAAAIIAVSIVCDYGFNRRFYFE